MRTWLLGIVLTSLAGGLARQLAPKGREQSMVRLVSGLLLALALLRPLAGQKWEDLELDAFPLPESREIAEASRKNQMEAFSAIIEEKTEAYICDKAEQLGLDCKAEVSTGSDEGGVPLPESVVIRGPYSEALARSIAEEVGIPAEQQIWLEEKEWKTESES